MESSRIVLLLSLVVCWLHLVSSNRAAHDDTNHTDNTDPQTRSEKVKDPNTPLRDYVGKRDLREFIGKTDPPAPGFTLPPALVTGGMAFPDSDMNPDSGDSREGIYSEQPGDSGEIPDGG